MTRLSWTATKTRNNFPHMLLYKLGYDYLLHGSSEHRNLTCDMFEYGILRADEIPEDDYHECRHCVGRKCWLKLNYNTLSKTQKSLLGECLGARLRQ
jgi:hypothetical protein